MPVPAFTCSSRHESPGTAVSQDDRAWHCEGEGGRAKATVHGGPHHSRHRVPLRLTRSLRRSLNADVRVLWLGNRHWSGRYSQQWLHQWTWAVRAVALLSPLPRCGAYVRTLRHLGEYRLVIHSAWRHHRRPPGASRPYADTHPSRLPRHPRGARRVHRRARAGSSHQAVVGR